MRDADPARVRVHICRGSYEGPHVRDIAMVQTFSTLMPMRARQVLFKAANPAMPKLPASLPWSGDLSSRSRKELEE